MAGCGRGARPPGPAQMPAMQVSWNTRGAWLLQAGLEEDGGREDLCGGGGVATFLDVAACHAQSLHALLLLVGLCITIITIVCAFAFFREDKEEQITPLCPQLVVREAELVFKLPLDSQADSMVVSDLEGRPRCRVVLDWSDPFRPGASGVAATARLQSDTDQTLATVVARNLAVHPACQGLALCRQGCEIFGFVEPDTARRYHVRHRTGVHLLTLVGDFGAIDIEAINPVGSRVCTFKKIGDECHGHVLQYVDAGLVICSLLAAHVHRRLTMAMASPGTPLRLPASPLAVTPKPPGESPPPGATALVSAQEEYAAAAASNDSDGPVGSSRSLGSGLVDDSPGSARWPPASPAGAERPAQQAQSSAVAAPGGMETRPTAALAKPGQEVPNALGGQSGDQEAQGPDPPRQLPPSVA